MNKKTIYHSSLTSPTRITVESDAMKSKYADKKNLKPNDPGYYYLFVKVDGVDHTLSAENEAVAKALAQYKGQGEITVQAEGRDDQAVIKLLKSDGTSSVAQAPEGTPAPALVTASSPRNGGLEAFQAHLGKMSAAFTEIKRTVTEEMKASKGDKGDTEEMFQSEVMAMFINADRAGLINNLPA